MVKEGKGWKISIGMLKDEGLAYVLNDCKDYIFSRISTCCVIAYLNMHLSYICMILDNEFCVASGRQQPYYSLAWLPSLARARLVAEEVGSVRPGSVVFVHSTMPSCPNVLIPILHSTCTCTCPSHLS